MNLICPKDRLPLTDLKCSAGHEYLSFEGIPVLVTDDTPDTTGWTHHRSLQIAQGKIEPTRSVGGEIDPYVQLLVASAAGFLYDPMVNKMKAYPIPEIPLPEGHGRTLLDVGCNWGRWVFAAARSGYKVTGIDSSLEILLVARQVAKQLGLEAEFICADARCLPFDQEFDQAFSFSVLQHLSKQDARLAFNEMKRVSRKSKVEIPGKYGLRAFQHQLGRKFREPAGFEVRYWTPKELRQIGDVSVHCYFGTGILSCDAHLMPWKYRMVIHTSEMLRKLSNTFRPLRSVADSYYVEF